MKSRITAAGVLLLGAVLFFSVPSSAKACAVCVIEGEPGGCNFSMFFTCTQKFGGCQTGTGCSCCGPNKQPLKKVASVECSKATVKVKVVTPQKAAESTVDRQSKT
jgi:hypothetical protein